MIAMLFRTFILYFFIVGAMRLMGKRQIAQLEPMELVTITMLSELAAEPISNNDIPILHGIIPIAVLIALEVITSFITMKSHTATRVFDGRPAAVIFKGELRQSELADSRITMNELIASMRGQGIFNLSDVDYAFLESNGSISFVPKRAAQPASVGDMGLAKDGESKGVDHAIVIDGHLSRDALASAAKSDAWFRSQLEKFGVGDIKDIFYMSCDDAGNVNLIKKEKPSRKKGKPKSGA